jgi:hypothetical protein
LVLDAVADGTSVFPKKRPNRDRDPTPHENEPGFGFARARQPRVNPRLTDATYQNIETGIRSKNLGLAIPLLWITVQEKPLSPFDGRGVRGDGWDVVGREDRQ